MKGKKKKVCFEFKRSSNAWEQRVRFVSSV